MSYVTVKEDSSLRLHLCREPTARAWAIFVALVSLGLGAAYYSVDYLVWKLAYLSGAIFVGLSCMEDWEDCTLDKSTGKIEVKKQSLIQTIFQATKGPKIVTAECNEVTDVRVEVEEARYGTHGYVVVLHFASGYSVGVTETATTGDKGEHEAIAEKIRRFLDLKPSPVVSAGVGDTLSVPTALDEDYSSSSDDSFEQIDKDELTGMPLKDSDSTQEKTEPIDEAVVPEN